MKTEAASFSSNLCAPSDACRAAWASMRASASACRRPRRCRPSLPRAPFPPCGGPAQTGTSAASRRRGTATGGALGVYAGLSGMLYHGMKIVCKRGMRAVQIPVSNPETKIQRQPKVSDENAMPRLIYFEACYVSLDVKEKRLQSSFPGRAAAGCRRGPWRNRRQWTHSGRRPCPAGVVAASCQSGKVLRKVEN